MALDWGFETLDTDEIISAINPANAPSIRVAERLGERYVRDDIMNGAPCRIYAITRDEWHALRGRT